MEDSSAAYMESETGENNMTSDYYAATRPVNSSSDIDSARGAYMERREQAEKFSQSERGKYGIAKALYCMLEGLKGSDDKTDKALRDDAQYIFSNVYAPFLRYKTSCTCGTVRDGMETSR